MGCNSNKNLGGLRKILDFDITYTGCATDCGGVEIRTGDSLRNVLDALVANCDGGGDGGGGTNFWFSVDTPEFTEDVKIGDYALTSSGAIFQFTGGSWVATGIQIGGGSGGDGATWGDITGEIVDQADLTDYIRLLIDETPISENKVGHNMHLSEDGKLNAGAQLDVEVPDDFSIEGFGFSLDGEPITDVVNDKGLIYYAIKSDDAEIENFTLNTGGAIQLRVLPTEEMNWSTGIQINQGGQGADRGVRIGYLHGSLSQSTDRVDIVASESVFIGGGGTSAGAPRPSVNISEVSDLNVHVFANSADPDVGHIDLLAQVGDINLRSSAAAGGAKGGNMLLSAEVSIEVRTPSLVYSEEPTISEDLQITHKKYVDDLIAAQQAIIDDLTARLEALEA